MLKYYIKISLTQFVPDYLSGSGQIRDLNQKFANLICGTPISLCTKMYFLKVLINKKDKNLFSPLIPPPANISKVSTCKLLQLERKKTHRAVKEANVIAVLAHAEDGGGGASQF